MVSRQFKNAFEGTYFEGIMMRNGEVMLAIKLSGQTDMRAILADALIT